MAPATGPAAASPTIKTTLPEGGGALPTVGGEHGAARADHDPIEHAISKAVMDSGRKRVARHRKKARFMTPPMTSNWDNPPASNLAHNPRTSQPPVRLNTGVSSDANGTRHR
jgi:hypothetical protein